MSKELIKKIISSDLCTGCGLCCSIFSEKISNMEFDHEGYLRPIIARSFTDTEEVLLSNICPGIHVKHYNFEFEGEYKTLWGPTIGTRIGYAADEEARFIGSSGGAISAILMYLLKTDEVDFILHVCADVDSPLLNSEKISVNRADVLSAAGSRYSPSAPLMNIDKHLAMKKKFAVVAKPCDIAALKNYARVNSSVNAYIPYMISFMCAGIPSINGTYDILRKLGVDKDNIKKFRYRGNGWPGSTTAVANNGDSFSMTYDESWGTILNRSLQFRCKICPDGTGEFADIVCADAWFGSDGYPDFSEKSGRSLIISRTLKGENLLSKCDELVICTDKVDDQIIEKMQPYQVERKKSVLARVLAIKTFIKMAPTFKNLELKKAASSHSYLLNIKNYLGTLKRIFPYIRP